MSQNYDKDTIERKTVNGWTLTDRETREKTFTFTDDYIRFLNAAKTEREAAEQAEKMLQNRGFKPIDEMDSIKAGDKVYRINKGKGVYAAVAGRHPANRGINVIGAHIDSPRLDLKPNPLYEDTNIAFFKTHYYGGIRKYQWTTIPLALHGVVVKGNGEKISICIGEDDTEPVFVISDLLPHLAAKQNEKKLGVAIEGENLNIMLGTMPMSADTEAQDGKNADKGAEDKSDAAGSVKSNIMNLLNQKYGIKEIDFQSAELEAVPAFKARPLGLDGSLIASYGHDDRVCAYPALRALLEIDNPETTAVCILADKEEVGSQGNTGMHSMNFELFMMDFLEKTGDINPYSLQRLLSSSKCLSADVTAAFDPTYASVMEKNNAAYLGGGICFNKYTGARGKSGASDANAEYVAYVRGLLEARGIQYQISELGKVDEGGGGTIAYILANKGMEVLDAGVPVISMHAPYEAVCRLDVYMAFLAYKAFFEG